MEGSWRWAHEANRGRPLKPEHKAAIARGLKGKKKSPEHRAALSRMWRRSTRFLKADNRRAMERAVQAVVKADPYPGRARPRRGRTQWRP